MILIIPGEFTDLNTYINKERSNRFAGAAVKKKETARVAWACLAQKIKHFKDPVYIKYYWFCKNKRKDKSNISFARKFIEDGLIDAGVLQNDGWDDIEGFQDVFIIDKKNPRIEVDIYETNKGQAG